MDDTMIFGYQSDPAAVPQASTAELYLQQHHAGYGMHSSVPISTHWNHYTPSSFPSSLSHSSADTQPHQHRQYNTTVMQSSSYHSSAVDTLGFNGYMNHPTHHPQPAVQQVPLQSTTSQFKLDLLQSIDQHMQRTREASKRFNDDLLQLLQLQNYQLMQQMKIMEQIISNRNHQAMQQRSMVLSPTTVYHQHSFPPVVRPSTPPVQNTFDSTIVVNQEQRLMDHLIIPAHFHLQEQQQQEPQNDIVLTIVPITVPTPCGGNSENKIESSERQQQPSEVPKRSFSESIRSSINIINRFQSVCTKSSYAHDPVHPRYMRYLLDRNGHRMDSSRGSAPAFSDVFEWMINRGLFNRGKQRHPYDRSHHPVDRPRKQCIMQPSSLFVNLKIVAMTYNS